MILSSEFVAPLVGAWIEISTHQWQGIQADVAPLVGAWIEIVILPRGNGSY